MKTYFPFDAELASLAQWYEQSITGLNVFESQLLNSTRHPALVVPPEFVGLSPSDLRSHFVLLRSELETSYILKLVAHTEGKFRSDFQERAEQKKARTTWDKKFKRTWTNANRTHQRVRLKDDILDVWRKDVLAGGKSISMFVELLTLRHWLAHGRYWLQQSRAFDMQATLLRCEAALRDCGIS